MCPLFLLTLLLECQILSAQALSSTGPKGEGRRRPSRPTRYSSSSSSSSYSPSTGPKSIIATAPAAEESRPSRRPGQRPPPSPSQPFDGRSLTAMQISNVKAPAFDLQMELQDSNSLRCVSAQPLRFDDDDEIFTSDTSDSSCFEFLSLDDLVFDGSAASTSGDSFGLIGFSAKFNTDLTFRDDLRAAIRQDVFETTPFYQKLSEKAASILLLPDSSLEGSWRIPIPTTKQPNGKNKNSNGDSMHRMKHTTIVLQEGFSDQTNTPIPTGDDLLRAIGNLCGGPKRASTHFIDIRGRQNRRINHSWHLDAGSAGPDGTSRTVLWGFPREDEYRGCGVFSHVVPLRRACLVAQAEENALDKKTARVPMEPVLFEGTVDEKYIVRPVYEPGKELLLYRDIDVLHSAPDVAYRSSIMRFM